MFQILGFFFRKNCNPLTKVTPSFPATPQQEGEGWGAYYKFICEHNAYIDKYMLGNDIAWHVFYQ